MRKAIKIIAAIAVCYILIGYAIAGVAAFGKLTQSQAAQLDSVTLTLAILPYLLRFIVMIGIGIYLLLLSKKRYTPAIEISLIAVGYVVLPIAYMILTNAFSKALVNNTTTTISYQVVANYTNLQLYFSSADMFGVGSTLLLVALAFAIAEKFLVRKHGTSLEAEYPSIDRI